MHSELTSGIGYDDKNMPGAEGTMKACRVLVSHFSHSSQAAEKLQEKQHDRSRQLKVIQDVATRWWSTFDMTDRLVDVSPYLRLMEREGTLTCNLSPEQWNIVQLVRDVLKPFMLAQKVLEGEKYVTISFVPGMIFGIRSGLQALDKNEDVPERIQTLVPSTLLWKQQTFNGLGQDSKGQDKMQLLCIDSQLTSD
jgi:hypothetical protein